ncbi:MAG: LptF/LptG family permease [Gemmatimonadota bacterium]|nr:LptF/LptG family permease [Gemmatimonadota bacterium]
MKILTRYLLRAHLGPFLFAFGALTGVLLINTLAKEMANLAGKGLPLEVIGRFFLLFLPANVALTLPMAVLVSVLYTFAKMTADNEIATLKASGIDLKRLLLPLFAAAALITSAMVWFNDQVLSETNYELRQLMVDIGRKSPMLVLREGTINTIPSQDGRTSFYLRAGRIDAATNRLWDVTIYDVGNPRVARTIYADSGRMAFSEGRTDLLLRLFDGHLREVDFDNPASFQRLGFEQQMLRREGVGNTLELQGGSGYRGDREMSVAMLQGRIDTLHTELAQVRQETASAAQADLDRVLGTATPDADEATSAAATPAQQAESVAGTLRSAASRSSSLERQIREFQVEVQKKFSIAFATLVFVLIGAPLAMRFPQGGLGMTIAFSLSIFALYYVGLIGGETLADKGYVHPTLAMWGMNIIMTGLGLVGVSHLGRETGTSRGGGWMEIPKRLGRRLRRIPRVRRGIPAEAA